MTDKAFDISFVSPEIINTKNPDYILVGNKFIAVILITNYHYERQAAWLSDIINLGEGIETNIYYEPLNKSKIVKEITYAIGETGAKRKAMGENQSDVDIVDTALGHSRYMRQEMSVNNEDPYNIYILVSVTANSQIELEDKLRNVETMLGSKDIEYRRAHFRHEDGYIACLPFHMLEKSLKKNTRRNSLTTGVASTYPFCTFEYCDENGIFVGINEHNNSLVIVDIFNTAIYKNANAVILVQRGLIPFQL